MLTGDPLEARYTLLVHEGLRYVLPPVEALDEAFAWWNGLPEARQRTLAIAVRCATQAEVDTAGRALLTAAPTMKHIPRALLLTPTEPLDLRRVVGLPWYPGYIPGHCVNIDGDLWHGDEQLCDACGWGYPNDPGRRRPRLTAVVMLGDRIVAPWLHAIEVQCEAVVTIVLRSPKATLIAAPEAPALPTTPGPRRPSSVCIDPECALSDGLAHGGPCEACACGEEHAVEECPKNPDAAYPRCVSCGAWEDEAPDMRFVAGRNLHIRCAV